MNGSIFVEVDNERDAAKEVENLNSEVDALIEARNLTVEQLEILGRVLFGKDTTKMTTAELKRDMLVYAKKSPHNFLNAIKDPMLKLQSNVHRFFDAKVLVFKNNRKDVFFNTASNKKKMITIPYGQDPMYVVASYLQSDDGIEVLKFLETELEMVGS